MLSPAQMLDTVELISLATAAVAGYGAVRLWRGRARSASAAPLAVVLGSGALYALAAVGADWLPAVPAGVAGYAVLPLVGVLVGGALWYVLGLTGRTAVLGPRLLAVLAVEPVLVTVASTTDPWLGWVSRPADNPTGMTLQWGFWAHTAYCYGLLLLTAVLLVRSLMVSVAGQRTVHALVLASMAFPVVGNVVSLTSRAVDVDLTSVMFLATAGAWTWVERNRQDLQRPPITTRQVLQAVTDAVVVVDVDGTVVDANASAHRMLARLADSYPAREEPRPADGRPAAVVGARWDRLVGTELADLLAGQEVSTVTTASGDVLDVRVTPVTTSGGADLGWVVVARDVTELERLRSELAELALRDPLTGLHNRRHLDGVLPTAVAAARDRDEPLTAVAVDIDHFKSVNDRFGHGTGDRVLTAVAHELRTGVRPNDVVARVGGEEFVLLLPGATPADLTDRLEELRRRCAAVRLPDVPELHVTVSAGVASLGGIDDPAALLEAADAALYRAKATGRDRVVVGATPP